MIDIRSALAEALPQLNVVDNDARLEAEILLGHVLNKNRAYLFSHPELILEPKQLQAFRQLIDQRALGVPIAYLLGTREFWSLSLRVTKDTLIPRHETERLVELALELIPDVQATRVLDLGTGSGAIALALAKERPHWEIIACDKSEAALQVAQDNAHQLNLANIRFYHSDWFNSLPAMQYHAIISNPPYIAATDPHLKEGDVVFEPVNALVSGQDGLADLQCIIQESYNRLKPNGLLLLEHGYDQKIATRTILKELGYLKVHCWQDIQGNDRVSGGWHPDNAT